MSVAKTAALMSCSTAIGALLAGAPALLVEGLAAFGRHLGLAFQGVDDLLGTWGDPVKTGKPIGNDLRQKKKTLPVVFTLCGEGLYGEQLRRILSLPVVSDADAARATELLERSGARQWVTDLVERETALCMRTLAQLPIPGGVRAELEEVALFVAVRDA
jgi:geranylgeranyl diphosphate synthase type I